MTIKDTRTFSRIGYARESRDHRGRVVEPTITRQIAELRAAGADEVHIAITDSIGPTNRDLAQLLLLSDQLKKGSSILVVDLSRLGLTTTAMRQLFIELKNKHIDLVSLSDPVDLTSTDIHQLLSAFEKAERFLSRERTYASLFSAKTASVSNSEKAGGRHQLYQQADIDRATQFVRNGLTVKKALAQAGIPAMSPATFYRRSGITSR